LCGKLAFFLVDVDFPCHFSIGKIPFLLMHSSNSEFFFCFSDEK
jgi:hypothetical protein